jgi:hypothetical protein
MLGGADGGSWHDHGPGGVMGVRTFIEGWPVYRQLRGTDPLGRGAATKSAEPGSIRCCTGGRTAPTGSPWTWTRRWT